MNRSSSSEWSGSLMRIAFSSKKNGGGAFKRNPMAPAIASVLARIPFEAEVAYHTYIVVTMSGPCHLNRFDLTYGRSLA